MGSAATVQRSRQKGHSGPRDGRREERNDWRPGGRREKRRGSRKGRRTGKGKRKEREELWEEIPVEDTSSPEERLYRDVYLVALEFLRRQAAVRPEGRVQLVRTAQMQLGAKLPDLGASTYEAWQKDRERCGRA